MIGFGNNLVLAGMLLSGKLAVHLIIWVVIALSIFAGITQGAFREAYADILLPIDSSTCVPEFQGYWDANSSTCTLFSTSRLTFDDTTDVEVEPDVTAVLYNGTMTIGATSTLYIADGGVLNSNGHMDNSGYIVNSGTWVVGKTVGVNETTGLNTGVDNVGTIINSGILTVSNSATLNNGGNATDSRGIINNTGTITNAGLFNNFEIINNFYGAVINNYIGGTLKNYPGHTINNSGTINNCGTFANYGSVIGNPVSEICDSDNDGIFDVVDILPTTFSADFSDDNATTTAGSIITRGDQLLIVSDAPNPAEGLEIVSQGGTTPAQLSFCNGAVIATLTAGDEIIKTGCSPDPIHVIQGPVELQLIGEEGSTATVSLETGFTISFDPATFSFGALPENPGSIQITLGDGALITLAPGQTLQGHIQTVGGEDIGIDMTSLFVAGALANSTWLLPVIGAAASVVASYFVARRVG